MARRVLKHRVVTTDPVGGALHVVLAKTVSEAQAMSIFSACDCLWPGVFSSCLACTMPYHRIMILSSEDRTSGAGILGFLHISLLEGGVV